MPQDDTPKLEFLVKPVEEMTEGEQLLFYRIKTLQHQAERDHFMKQAEQAQEDRAALKGMVERARADGHELQRELDMNPLRVGLRGIMEALKTPGNVDWESAAHGLRQLGLDPEDL